MAQNYTDDTYNPSHNAATDLQNIENNFAALKSGFSGATAPPNVVGGMVWHSGSGRYVRDYSNSQWLVSLMGSADFKIWVYRNDTDEGWVVDSSVTDVVCGIKGGSRAFNVDGGNLAGSWTLSGLTGNSHTHTYSGTTSPYSGSPSQGATINSSSDQLVRAHSHAFGGTTSGTVGVQVVSSDATWRIRAAVGTLQYPDLS